MTVVKLLFVLALAVPLMVFMGYYIVNLQKEFFKNMKEQQMKAQKNRHSDIDERRTQQAIYRRTYENNNHREETRRLNHMESAERSYDSQRANFDNLEMKRRYEQSITARKRISAKNSGEEAVNDRNKNIKKTKVRKKNKRKRRKELRNKRKT